MTNTATASAVNGAGQPIPILDHLADIEKRITGASHLALFLDFDGTLSPIVPTPQEAALDGGVRPILEELARRNDISIAIISGRSMTDVRERVGLSGVVYAGNHGLEAENDTISYRNPEAEAVRRELKCTLLQLRLALSETDGLEIEDKGLTLAVHFRRVTEHLHDWVRSITLSTVGRSRSFTCREGKMVIDIKPRIEWHKGYAVQWILKEIMPSGALPIYLGDDVTDEDAFASIREGITIKVGGSVETGAHYKLPDVPSVGQFLNWLNHAKPHESLATA
ncbi:MAG TPA: trehalose-phosphatase [Bryobacteraceae bacterium]|nr:trehalose-phosphatase [Bryobacteraceae bacterium]